MKLLAIFLGLILAFSSKALAYSPDQLQECILGVKQNPIVLGVPEDEIVDFCNCALESIVDQDKDDRATGIECTAKSFH